jgi:hypothetical protein
MAQSVGVTPTYYRLIEAGQVPIAMGRVSDLIRVFAPQKVYIDFSSLAALLTGIAILEKSLIDEVDVQDPFQSLVAYSDFEELLKKTRPYFGFQEGNADQQDFLETTAYDAVREFLETSPSLRDQAYPHLSLKDVSAGGVEVLRNLHRQLVGRRFVGEKAPK